VQSDGDGAVAGEKERIFGSGFRKNTVMWFFPARETLFFYRNDNP